MAVAFDAVGSGSQHFQGLSTPLTVNVTVVSATNGYIVVAVAVGAAAATEIASVTIGGAAATQMTGCTVNSNNGAAGGLRLYGKTNAATGVVACVVATTTDASDLEVGVMSFTGVHQVTSFGSQFTAFGSSTAPTVGVTDSVAGDLVIDGLVNGSGATSTSSQTERWDVALNSNSAGGCGAGATAAGASGTVTMAHTLSPSDSWGIIGIALKQAAASVVTAMEWQSPAVQIQNHAHTSIISMRALRQDIVPYLTTTPTYVTNTRDWVSIESDVIWTGG